MTPFSFILLEGLDADNILANNCRRNGSKLERLDRGSGSNTISQPGRGMLLFDLEKYRKGRREQSVVPLLAFFNPSPVSG